MSETSDRLLEEGAAAQRAGQFEAAQRLAQEALEADPSSVPAMFLLGIAHARRGDPVRAEVMLQRVLGADPKSFQALISLSTVYRDLGRFDESISVGIRAAEAKPNDAQAHNNLGQSLLAARRLHEAAHAFERAAAMRPNFAAAHYNLGKTRQLQGKDGEAALAFSRASAVAPTLENLLALGHMLMTLCDYEAALACAQQCVSLHPDSAAAHLLLCGALTETDQIEAAESQLRQAIELDPECREALHVAARQRPLGYIDEANANLRRAIAHNPSQVSAYDSLMQNQKVTDEDRVLVSQMRSLADEGDFSPTELASLYYGLGKALEDLSEYEESMSYYDAANRLTRTIKFGETMFDEVRYRNHVQQMIRQFTPRGDVSEACTNCDLPIVVLGMMRGGTSLTEQILSSHPEVAGAGEQLFWSRNWMRAISGDTATTDPERICALGQEYVEALRPFARTARRVTDKMPGNYMFAGLIHQAVPNARIIHIRRNPVDTSLSIWATPNHAPHDGGHRKADITFVYKQYLHLMSHWRDVLPPNRFLEVDYESLVTDPEREILRMLTFCGLDWNDACLRPNENKRHVKTPSAWQVRQPFYQSSVARWKRFEPWLGEFRELLDVGHPSIRHQESQRILNADR